MLFSLASIFRSRLNIRGVFRVTEITVFLPRFSSYIFNRRENLFVKGGLSPYTTGKEGRIMMTSKIANAIYVDTKTGDDVNGQGTLENPLKSLNKAISHFNATSLEQILIKDDGLDKFVTPSASSFKKAVKQVSDKKRKEERAAERLADKPIVNDSNKEVDAKPLVANPDVLSRSIKINVKEANKHVGEMVKVEGWISKLRKHSDLVFIVVRNMGGYVQCVASDDVANSKQILSLGLESSVCVYGTVKKVPEGKIAPGNVEIIIDYIEIIGDTPKNINAFSNRLNHNAGSEVLYDLRHLVIRGDSASSVLRFRSKVLSAFRKFFDERNLVELTPPTIVKTETEGGSTLFGLKYHDQMAYLTQSSQFYLEAGLPSVGDCYCILPSYRAENSRTRRHLSEYTHLEVELGFISFDDLLNFMEDMIVDVIETVMNDPETSEIIKARNPKFIQPVKPFVRMTYLDAIDWLKENKVMKTVKLPNGSEVEEFYVDGDDIPESAERVLVDTIKKPILLNRFPVVLKAFYMAKDPENHLLTGSCDLLLPNVGETIGGGMRITDYDELINAFKSANIDPSDYYWYTDQRLYGSVPHGGFGLGVERLLAWVLDLYTVKMACLFPRTLDRCVP